MAPEDRFIDDRIVDSLECTATAVLTQHQNFSAITKHLASGIHAFLRDREARQELAIAQRRAGSR
jgi:hypothetical protein